MCLYKCRWNAFNQIRSLIDSKEGVDKETSDGMNPPACHVQPPACCIEFKQKTMPLRVPEVHSDVVIKKEKSGLLYSVMLRTPLNMMLIQWTWVYTKMLFPTKVNTLPWIMKNMHSDFCFKSVPSQKKWKQECPCNGD